MKKIDFCILSVMFIFPFVFVLDQDRFYFPQPVVGLVLNPTVDSGRGALYLVPCGSASQCEISYLPTYASLEFSR
jgi:hypothetical protein